MRTKKVDPEAAAEREHAKYEWLTPAQVGAMAGGVSDEQVRGWIKDGMLPALNVAVGKGRPRYRIAPAEAERFITETLAA